MSLIQFCPNTSFHLPFPFLPLGSFVALSYSMDRLSQTISVLQLALTIVSCITEDQAVFVSMRCAVFLFSLEKSSSCAAAAEQSFALGTSVFLGQGTGDYPASGTLGVHGPVVDSLNMMGNSGFWDPG